MTNQKKNTKSLSNFINRSKSFILYSLNPVYIISEERRHPWYYYLILPAFGWMLFFLQVGLYRNSQSHYPVGKIIILAVTGLVIGYASVLVISVLLTILLPLWKIKIRVDRVISSVALSHTYMTFSMLLGLIYSIFGTISPTTFGITGLMCTLLPIYAAIRSLGKKNAYIAPVLASIIGVLMLTGWQLILIINS